MKVHKKKVQNGHIGVSGIQSVLTGNLLLEARTNDEPDEECSQDGTANGDEQYNPPRHLIKAQHCRPSSQTTGERDGRGRGEKVLETTKFPHPSPDRDTHTHTHRHTPEHKPPHSPHPLAPSARRMRRSVNKHAGPVLPASAASSSSLPAPPRPVPCRGAPSPRSLLSNSHPRR